MNCKSRIMVSLGVLLVLSLLLTSMLPVAQAQDKKVLTGKSLFNINIRATPGINSAVIGVLPSNQEATAIGRTAGNNWIQVEYQGTTGWMAAWLLFFTGDTYSLPVTSDIQPPTISTGHPLTVISPYNVNIRKDPQVGAEVLATLPFNTEASATGRNETSSWVRVEYQDVEGWTAAWLVLLGGDINGLPVADGTTPPPPRITPTPTPTPEGGKTQPPAPATGITVLAPYRVNIRSAPIVDGTVIDVLPFNAKAAAIGRNAGNNWIQVEYNGTRGWVAGWVVHVSEATSSLPVTSDSTEITKVNVGLTGLGIYEIIIRSGPGMNFATLATLPANTNANLLARSADSDWIKLRYQGIDGWAAAWVLIASADINNLPVEESPNAP
jgi:uncharacterized protein YraI